VAKERINNENCKEDIINELHTLIMDLITESMDSDYSAEEQKRIHRHAKEVRKRRMALRGLEFNEKTEGYKEASEALEVVNKSIKEAIDRINSLVEFLGDLARLLAALDKIIQTAVAVA
jgi:hypothetical protein